MSDDDKPALSRQELWHLAHQPLKPIEVRCIHSTKYQDASTCSLCIGATPQLIHTGDLSDEDLATRAVKLKVRVTPTAKAATPKATPPGLTSVDVAKILGVKSHHTVIKLDPYLQPLHVRWGKREIKIYDGTRVERARLIRERAIASGVKRVAGEHYAELLDSPKDNN